MADSSAIADGPTFSAEFVPKGRDEISKEEVMSPGYDSEDSDSEGDDIDGQPTKRPRRSDDERLKRCRERNRVHARNTRERKKMQMDGLQYRIQELIDEKVRIKSAMSENSVASILMSLAGEIPVNEAAVASLSNNRGGPSPPATVVMFESARDVNHALEKLKMQVSAELSDDEEMLEVDHDLLTKDKTTCTSSDLDKIRRERNRMHAKKTRLRKKKMMRELELVISTLEGDVKDLRQGCIAIIAKASGRSLEHAAWLYHRAVNADSEQRLRGQYVPTFVDHQIPLGYGAAPLMYPGTSMPTAFPTYSDPTSLIALGGPKAMPDLLAFGHPPADGNNQFASRVVPPQSNTMIEKPEDKKVPAALRASGSTEALYSLLSLGKAGVTQDMLNYVAAPTNNQSASAAMMKTLADATTSIIGASPDVDSILEGRDPLMKLNNSAVVKSDVPSPEQAESDKRMETLKIVRSQFKPPSAHVGASAPVADSLQASAHPAPVTARLSAENLAAHTEAMERARAEQAAAKGQQQSISPTSSSRVHTVTETTVIPPELSQKYSAGWPIHPMQQHALFSPTPQDYHHPGMGMAIPPPQVLASRAYMAEYCNIMMPAPMRAAAGLRPSLSSPALSSLANCYPTPSRYELSQFTSSKAQNTAPGDSSTAADNMKSL